MGMKLALIIGAPCAAGLYVLAEPIIRLLFTALEGQEISRRPYEIMRCRRAVPVAGADYDGRLAGDGQAQYPCNQPGVWGNIEGYNYVDSHAHSHHKHTGRRDIHNNMLCGSRNLGYDLCAEKNGNARYVLGYVLKADISLRCYGGIGIALLQRLECRGP